MKGALLARGGVLLGAAASAEVAVQLAFHNPLLSLGAFAGVVGAGLATLRPRKVSSAPAPDADAPAPAVPGEVPAPLPPEATAPLEEFLSAPDGLAGEVRDAVGERLDETARRLRADVDASLTLVRLDAAAGHARLVEASARLDADVRTLREDLARLAADGRADAMRAQLDAIERRLAPLASDVAALVAAPDAPPPDPAGSEEIARIGEAVAALREDLAAHARAGADQHQHAASTAADAATTAVAGRLETAVGQLRDDVEGRLHHVEARADAADQARAAEARQAVAERAALREDVREGASVLSQRLDRLLQAVAEGREALGKTDARAREDLAAAFHTLEGLVRRESHRLRRDGEAHARDALVDGRRRHADLLARLASLEAQGIAAIAAARDAAQAEGARLEDALGTRLHEQAARDLALHREAQARLEQALLDLRLSHAQAQEEARRAQDHLQDALADAESRFHERLEGLRGLDARLDALHQRAGAEAEASRDDLRRAVDALRAQAHALHEEARHEGGAAHARVVEALEALRSKADALDAHLGQTRDEAAESARASHARLHTVEERLGARLAEGAQATREEIRSLQDSTRDTLSAVDGRLGRFTEQVEATAHAASERHARDHETTRRALEEATGDLLARLDTLQGDQRREALRLDAQADARQQALQAETRARADALLARLDALSQDLARRAEAQDGRTEEETRRRQEAERGLRDAVEALRSETLAARASLEGARERAQQETAGTLDALAARLEETERALSQAHRSESRRAREAEAKLQEAIAEMGRALRSHAEALDEGCAERDARTLGAFQSAETRLLDAVARAAEDIRHDGADAQGRTQARLDALARDFHETGAALHGSLDALREDATAQAQRLHARLEALQASQQDARAAGAAEADATRAHVASLTEALQTHHDQSLASATTQVEAALAASEQRARHAEEVLAARLDHAETRAEAGRQAQADAVDAVLQTLSRAEGGLLDALAQSDARSATRARETLDLLRSDGAEARLHADALAAAAQDDLRHAEARLHRALQETDGRTQDALAELRQEGDAQTRAVTGALAAAEARLQESLDDARAGLGAETTRLRDEAHERAARHDVAFRKLGRQVDASREAAKRHHERALQEAARTQESVEAVLSETTAARRDLARTQAEAEAVRAAVQDVRAEVSDVRSQGVTAQGSLDKLRRDVAASRDALLEASSQEAAATRDAVRATGAAVRQDLHEVVDESVRTLGDRLDAAQGRTVELVRTAEGALREALARTGEASAARDDKLSSELAVAETRLAAALAALQDHLEGESERARHLEQTGRASVLASLDETLRAVRQEAQGAAARDEALSSELRATGSRFDATLAALRDQIHTESEQTRRREQEGRASLLAALDDAIRALRRESQAREERQEQADALREEALRTLLLRLRDEGKAEAQAALRQGIQLEAEIVEARQDAAHRVEALGERNEALHAAALAAHHTRADEADRQAETRALALRSALDAVETRLDATLAEQRADLTRAMHDARGFAHADAVGLAEKMEALHEATGAALAQAQESMRADAHALGEALRESERHLTGAVSDARVDAQRLQARTEDAFSRGLADVAADVLAARAEATAGTQALQGSIDRVRGEMGRASESSATRDAEAASALQALGAHLALLDGHVRSAREDARRDAISLTRAVHEARDAAQAGILRHGEESRRHHEDARQEVLALRDAVADVGGRLTSFAEATEAHAAHLDGRLDGILQHVDAAHERLSTSWRVASSALAARIDATSADVVHQLGEARADLAAQVRETVEEQETRLLARAESDRERLAAHVEHAGARVADALHERMDEAETRLHERMGEVETGLRERIETAAAPAREAHERVQRLDRRIEGLADAFSRATWQAAERVMEEQDSLRADVSRVAGDVRSLSGSLRETQRAATEGEARLRLEIGEVRGLLAAALDARPHEDLRRDVTALHDRLGGLEGRLDTLARDLEARLERLTTPPPPVSPPAAAPIPAPAPTPAPASTPAPTFDFETLSASYAPQEPARSALLDPQGYFFDPRAAAVVMGEEMARDLADLRARFHALDGSLADASRDLTRARDALVRAGLGGRELEALLAQVETRRQELRRMDARLDEMGAGLSQTLDVARKAR